MSSGNYLQGLDYSVLQQCIHCGLCLPTCPTYDDTRKETSSPRGRIALMRAVADGALGVTAGFAWEMDFCLGCLACQSACPADVKYAELIERARSEVQRVRPSGNPLRRLALNFLFTSRARIRLLGVLVRWYQRSGLQRLVRATGLLRLLGGGMPAMEALLPPIDRRFTPCGVFPAIGEKKRRVGVLAGCVQDIAFAQINHDTIDVLRANGCEVVVPAAQQCCGSIHGHNGEHETARRMARANLAAFPLEQLDAVIVNAAGCGSFLKHYDRLLDDDPAWRQRARLWSQMARDISEFLCEIGFRRPAAGGGEATVRLTYHDACHLCHGQGIRRPPRRILQALPGYQFTELAESEWCCGSAGIYNITHPELAGKLLERKIGHLRDTGAAIAASANPGCTIQIEAGARQAGLALRVEHPISLLAQAYRAEPGSPLQGPGLIPEGCVPPAALRTP